MATPEGLLGWYESPSSGESPGFFSLCLYECPAAEHLLDDWRLSMLRAGRLLSWEPLDRPGVYAAHVRRSTVEAVEVMVCIPTGMLQALMEVDRKVWGEERLAPYKVIHFGALDLSLEGVRQLKLAVSLTGNNLFG